MPAVQERRAAVRYAVDLDVAPEQRWQRGGGALSARCAIANQRQRTECQEVREHFDNRPSDTGALQRPWRVPTSETATWTSVLVVRLYGTTYIQRVDAPLERCGVERERHHEYAQYGPARVLCEAAACETRRTLPH